MHVFEVVYGLLFVIILIIKYFKGKELDRRAVTMLVWGLAALVGGGLLALLVSLGSATGGIVMSGLAATASGALLVIALHIELIGPLGGAAAPRPPVRPRPPAGPAPRPPAPPKPAVEQPPEE